MNRSREMAGPRNQGSPPGTEKIPPLWPGDFDYRNDYLSFEEILIIFFNLIKFSPQTYSTGE